LVDWSISIRLFRGNNRLLALFELVGTEVGEEQINLFFLGLASGFTQALFLRFFRELLQLLQAFPRHVLQRGSFSEGARLRLGFSVEGQSVCAGYRLLSVGGLPERKDGRGVDEVGFFQVHELIDGLLSLLDGLSGL